MSEEESLNDESLNDEPIDSVYPDEPVCGQSSESLVPHTNPEETLSVFTNDEITCFTRRKEEGYDIKTDLRYNLWLSLQSSSSSHSDIFNVRE